MQNILKKSFLKTVVDIAGVNFWISLFVSIVIFVSNILIILVLYKILNQPSNVKDNVEILLFLIASRFLMGIFQLLTEKGIRKNFFNYITNYFKNSCWELIDKSLISTLISRDILLLLDTIPAISKLLYFPICFIIGVMAIYQLIGLNGVVAISTVILFIPLSLFVAKKSIQLASDIYRLSKVRLENVSRWLEWRSIIYNWVDSSIPLKRIITLTEKEIIARNLDSIWRCLDLYVVIFGRCLPAIVIILSAIIFKNDLSSQLILTMWLSVPFVALVMEFGRFASDFQLGKQALAELQKASKPLLNSSASCLVLDNNWEIWDGTFSENCLIDEDNAHFELSQKLRLDKEFAHPIPGIYLSRFGENISEGQKTRILIIRGIHLAIKSNLQLKIDCNLNSLDPDACHRLMRVLKMPEIADKIILSQSCMSFLENQLTNYDAISIRNNKLVFNEEENKSERVKEKPIDKNLINDLFLFVNPLVLAFLFPAMGLSFVGYIAITSISLSAKFIIILFISLSSIISAISLGAKNESGTRVWAKEKMVDILLNAKLTNPIDIFQRLSRDFSMVIERISWYVHDITWLLSLLLVSIIATVISFGMLGVWIIIVFLLLGVSIWKFFEIRINVARIASVGAVNRALIMGQNLVCYGALANLRFLKEKREAIIYSNMYDLYQSNIKLVSLKIIFSNLIMCVSGLFILATLIGSMYSLVSEGLLVFILTAILSVDASISILFQALSGFSAQRASIHRLLDYEKQDSNFTCSLVEKNLHQYFFNGGFNPNIKVKYLPVTFDSGNAYSVLGESGIGKSQFLKFISGIDGSIKNHLNDGVQVLYLNKEAQKIASWTQDESLDSMKLTKENFEEFLKMKILNGPFKVIVLDEALTEFDIHTANKIVHLIKYYISKIGGLLLFVDHRFNLSKSISMFDIQLSSE